MKPLRYQVNLFFLYSPHPIHMASSGIDFCNHPHLRLLQINLGLQYQQPRESRDKMIMVHWLNSVCERITSKSLAVEVRGFSQEFEWCGKVQDILLALRGRIETFSVYLRPGTKEQGLFSKLYDVGIVVEAVLECRSNEAVCHCIFSSPALLFTLP